MRVLIILIFALYLAPIGSLGQGYNNYWYFGRKAGIHFTNGSPTALIDGQMDASEGVATISDVNGNLLFYTNGRSVYGRNHQIIQNGSGLLGGASSSQAATLLKKPGNNDIYYVLTTGDHIDKNGLRYSEIQLDSNNGFGAINANKNILLNSSHSEKVVCVLHANYIDFWIVYYHNDSISSYLVTENGINHTPVENPLNISNFDADIGYLKISPNGKHLGLANLFKNEVQLYDFNDKSGIADPTPIILPQRSFQDVYGVYGIEFSPNSQFLYAFEQSANNAENLDTAYIYQYDLKSIDINNSKRIAGFGLGRTMYSAAQLAPDRKIYFVQFAGQDAAYLHSIEHPDSLGSACEVKFKSVHLNGGYGSFGLPNFQNNYSLINVEDGCYGDSTHFTFLPENVYTALEWNFDDPASGASNADTSRTPSHLYSSPGTYYPSLKITWKNGDIITVNTVVTIYANPIIDLGPDTTICMVDDFEITFNIAETNVNILWQDSSTQATYSITDTGTYWVRVNRNNCIVRDTIKITQAKMPQFKLPEDTSLCQGNALILNYDTIAGNYLWSTGNTSSSDTIVESGLYWLEIGEAICKHRDSINVTVKSSPKFNLGKDTTLCLGDSLILNFDSINGNYLWSSGNNTAIDTISSEGIFWLEIANGDCSFRDSIEVIIDPLQLFSLGADTSICEGETLILNSNVPLAEHSWSTGDENSTIEISQEGTYWLEVKSNSCMKRDSILISTIKLPLNLLPKDTMVCNGLDVTFDLSETKGTIAWSDGDSSKEYHISSSGTYMVTLYYEGCFITDTTTVVHEECDIIIRLPNVFTPNNDNQNDKFKVIDMDGIESMETKIFSRWGNLIYETNDLEINWDGQGSMDGTYFWMISGTSIYGNSFEKSGNVSLFR